MELWVVTYGLGFITAVMIFNSLEHEHNQVPGASNSIAGDCCIYRTTLSTMLTSRMS